MDLSSFFMLLFNFWGNFIQMINVHSFSFFGLEISLIDVMISIIFLGMFYSVFFRGAKG